MKKEDINQIVEALNTSNGSSNNEAMNKLVDTILKIVLTVGAPLLVYVAATVNQLEKNQNEMAIDQEYTKRQLAEFVEFMKEPRFTHLDYQQETAPILQTLNRHDQQLSDRNEWMKGVNSRLGVMESEMKNLREDLQRMDRMGTNRYMMHNDRSMQ